MAKPKAKAAPPKPKNLVVGEVENRPLASVKPNGWNPNRMSDFMKESLKVGLKTDGWIVADALLVWGKDKKGRVQNRIIDGEHRWTVATEMGFTEGPMVFLNGITEAEAKALTIKMNQKHGEFVRENLEEVIRSIQHGIAVEDLSLDLGIPEEDIMVMLAEPEIVLPGEALDTKPPAPPGEIEMPSGKMEHTRMVQLFFDPTVHAEFLALIAKHSKKYGTQTVTDTILETFRHVPRAAHSAS